MFGVLVMCLGLFSDELQVELKMSRFRSCSLDVSGWPKGVAHGKRTL